MALNLSRVLSDSEWKQRNEQRNSLKNYFGAATELNHYWEEKDSQKLSPDDINNIDSAVIKQGTYGKNLVFLMKSGKPRVINWSTQAPDYMPGTKISLTSIEITKVIDTQTGNTVFRASGQAL